MRRYRITLHIVCLLMAINTFSENERSICMLLKSGAMIQFPVSEHPKIIFDGTIIRVGNGDYQIENVRKWMIGDPEEIAQGIEDVKAGNAIVYKNGILTVGLQTNVRAYNAAGIEMPVQVKDGRVDMTAWPQDIYVIKAGTETIKIRKR